MASFSYYMIYAQCQTMLTHDQLRLHFYLCCELRLAPSIIYTTLILCMATIHMLKHHVLE